MRLHLRIAGTGRYLPEERITNEFFEGLEKLFRYDASDNITEVFEGKRRITKEKIFEITGIRERRRTSLGDLPSDLGYRAACDAIEKSGVKADSIVGIIFNTLTEKRNIPSAACKIQKKLGIRNCFAYDINNACAGFPEAIGQANSRVLRREGNYLVVAAECLTSIVDYTDINSTLFGDGAGAAVLTPTEEERGILAEYSVSNPFENKVNFIFLNSKGVLRMPYGKEVMKNAVREMLESARWLKKELDWERADVYIPHQANGRIIDAIKKRISEEGSVVYNNIARYGNMSAATCAIALDEALEDGTIQAGKKVIITSFGAGLVTAAVAVEF
ncbi:MAG: ketoacyl-ACP synthase III [Nanoarchaeota archaeon]